MTGPGAALVALPSLEGGMGMLRGKSRGISPRSGQVARLRYSLLAMGEKYTRFDASRLGLDAKQCCPQDR